MKSRYLLTALAALAAVAPPAPAETEAQYYAALVDGKKVGHAVMSRTATKQEVTHQVESLLEIRRAGQVAKMRQRETTVETPDGKPLRFSSDQDLGIMSMKVEGTVAKGMMTLKITSAGQTKTVTRNWPKGALLPEGLALLTRKMGLKEGTTYAARMFEPSLLQVLEAKAHVGPKKKADLLGRVVELTEIKTTTTVPTVGMTITSYSYVNDEYDALKTVIPVAGMKVEMIACSRAFALSKNDPADFLEKMLVAAPAALKDLPGAESVTYHLSPKGKAELKVPALDGQAVRAGKAGTVLVTVRRVAAPQGVAMPYKGTDKAARAALEPNRFLQSDRKEVIALARKAAGDAKDAARAAKRIRDFVHTYVHKKDFSIGYASAVEVAKSREGDCSEHAVLAAALCRAVGIPAEMVIGVVYVPLKDRAPVFGAHAWYRVFLDGKWVQMDAALPDGWGLGHLALATGSGNIDDFFQLLGTLGQFSITQAEVEKKKP